ncbi:MAG: hypothetical protein LBG69_04130 [Zoogloeaceae bacterium]|jgi:hypothetical protein|nr:hypothetical protein [Zoogloeaceae bacterium]
MSRLISRGLAFLFSIFLLVCSATAEEKSGFASNDEFEEWMFHYFQRPDPARAQNALSRLMASYTRLPLTLGFTTGLFQKNPRHLKEWLKTLEQCRKDCRENCEEECQARAAYFLAALRLADRADAAVIVQKRYPEAMRTIPFTPQPIMQATPEEGGWPDILLGYFLATGEDAAILRIMEMLAWETPETRQEDENRYQTGRSAWLWLSLSCEMPGMEEVCGRVIGTGRRALAETLDPARAAILRRLLVDLEEKAERLKTLAP